MTQESEDFKREVDNFIKSFDLSIHYIEDFLNDYRDPEKRIPPYVFIDLKYKLLCIDHLLRNMSILIRNKPFMVDFRYFVHNFNYEFVKEVNKSDFYPAPQEKFKVLLKKFKDVFKKLSNLEFK